MIPTTPYTYKITHYQYFDPNIGHNRGKKNLKTWHLYGQLLGKVCPLLGPLQVSVLHQMGPQDKHKPLLISSRGL